MKPSKLLLTIFSLMVIVSMVTACAQATPLPAPPTEPPAAPAATEAPAAEEPAATEAPAAEEPAMTEAPAEVGKPPAITVDDMQGVPPGKYPNQYELAEFEAATGGTLEFTGRTEFDPLLTAIFPGIPADVNERLPEEPLVVVPYDEIGKYGGQLEGLSLGPESGNSEYLSWRHATLVRYAEDLDTIVPNLVRTSPSMMN
jgi:hypothetical protein